MNLDVEKLRKEIVRAVNNSNLPVSVIYYLMKDLFNDISIMYQQSLLEEQKQLTEEITENIEE